jgi:hypothetical protein
MDGDPLVPSKDLQTVSSAPGRNRGSAISTRSPRPGAALRSRWPCAMRRVLIRAWRPPLSRRAFGIAER